MTWELRKRLPIACLQLSIAATPENVRLVRHTVASAAADAGADALALADISLAVTEAVSNAVQHAYAPGRGSAHVSVERNDATLVIVVGDDGRGFTPADGARGKAAGGLGLELMERLTRELDVSSGAGDGTEIRMVFALRGSD